MVEINSGALLRNERFLRQTIPVLFCLSLYITGIKGMSPSELFWDQCAKFGLIFFFNLHYLHY